MASVFFHLAFAVPLCLVRQNRELVMDEHELAVRRVRCLLGSPTALSQRTWLMCGNTPSWRAARGNRPAVSVPAHSTPPAKPQVQAERPQRSEDERPGGTARRRATLSREEGQEPCLLTKRHSFGAPTVSLQEFVCAAPNVAFCARKPMMPAGTPACAPDLDRIADRQRKRTRCRVRGHYRYQAPAGCAHATDTGGSAGWPGQRAAVATRRVMPQSGRTFSACGPFCPWVVSNSTFWFSSSDL